VSSRGLRLIVTIYRCCDRGLREAVTEEDSSP